MRLKAKQLLHEWEHANQLSLFAAGESLLTAKLINWRVTGFHQVFGVVYDRIGFPDNLLRDLVIARIAHPKSKSATRRYLEQYLGIAIAKSRLFRFLDTLDKDKLTKIACNFVAGFHPQGISVCFYDATTLHFEITDEDGLRQKGFSKNHRSDTPQILVGLFVDSRGYPFDFDFFEGKTFEGHTFIAAMEAIRRKYGFSALTVVADAGMLSRDNLNYLDSVNTNYIVGARIKNLPQELTQKILRHPFSRQPMFQTEVGNQLLLVNYCPERAGRDAWNRERTIAKLKQKLADGKAVIRKSKYLLIAGKHRAMGISSAKVKLDQKFDGLKGYFTNRDNQAEAEEIISQYRQLWQVERAFRMSKHDLRERPVFHSRANRIRAHLSLCFVSLLVMKETERYLTAGNCSLKRAIELLGKVGQGIVRVGTIELVTETEVDPATQLILKLFEGH